MEGKEESHLCLKTSQLRVFFFFPSQETSGPGTLLHELGSARTLWVEDIYRPRLQAFAPPLPHQNLRHSAQISHVGPGYLNSGSHA